MFQTRTLLVLLALAVVALAIRQADGRKPPPRIGTITHPPLREASGMVKSRKHTGVFWTINDSGNAPHLFAIDRTGKLLAEYKVNKAPNVDWEALAQDDEGNLYVGDVGNNVIGLGRRHVYQVKEPDPVTTYEKSGKLPELEVARKFTYLFPQRPFDVEAMFCWRGSIYLVSKVHGNQPTHLYRLALDTPGKDVPLVEVCPLPGVRVVTDANLSADGKRLALCGYDWAARFDLNPDEPLTQLASKQPAIVRFASTGIEACAWDGDELILLSESREIYLLRF